MDEQWREIPGTDYSASDCGRIASRKKGGWRVLRPSTDSRGYLYVVFGVNGLRKNLRVHSLVAEAFLGPKPTPKHEVNHRSGVRLDNRAVNLEYVTRSENMLHGYRVLGNKAARGEKNGRAKLTEVEARAILRRLAGGEFGTALAVEYGIHNSSVYAISNGKSWAWLGR